MEGENVLNPQADEFFDQLNQQSEIVNNQQDEETINMVRNSEAPSQGIQKQSTKIKMQNDNSDDDDFYQDQNNHQFDDFDSDGEELVNAASKVVNGPNFDDSDEEFKNHSVPLDHRGTEIKQVNNMNEEEKIFAKMEQTKELHHRTGSLSSMKDLGMFKQGQKQKDVITSDDFHEGILDKQSPKLIKIWQSRYFVLDKRVLKYYKNKQEYESGNPPKGVINFQQVAVLTDFLDASRKINLRIKGSNRVFNLRAKNENDYQTWKKKINHSVSSSNGVQKDLTISTYSEDVENSFKFWRFMRISEEAFFQQAETGDILICSNKSKNIATMGQSGQQDVVGVFMIIKLNGEDEAEQSNLRVIRPGTIDQGIMIDDWEQFKMFKYQKFTDVFYRHIHVDRSTEKFSQGVQKFIEEIQKVSNVEYVDKKTGANIKRPYNPSELVAKFFKDTDLLDNKFEKNLEEYVPKDFSQKQLKSDNFGPEQSIMIKDRDLDASIADRGLVRLDSIASNQIKS